MSKQMESVYREAAAILRKQGWCQNTFGSPQGPVCMAGAISLVQTEGRSPRIPWLNDATALATICGDSISEFNDDHCETVDDAIAALEIAADIEACS